MFSSKSKASASHYDTLISSKTEIVGDIKFKGGVQIEGTVKGSLTAEAGSGAIVRISETGRIEGKINAPHVVVNGAVVGDIYANEYIELAKKARIQGDVYYHKMEMVLGAEVNGRLLHQDKSNQSKKSIANDQSIDQVKSDQSGDKVD